MSASTERKNRQAAREAGTDKKTLAEQAEAKKKAKSKTRWTLGTIGVILLIAVILFLNSSALFSITTALTIGGEKYSPAQVNYYYSNQYYSWVNNYGSYASMFGLDTSSGVSGLDSQTCPMLEDGTWKDYFLQSATQELTQTRALLDYAADNGITLTDEEIASVDSGFDGIEEYAKSAGYSSVNKFFAANYGSGVTQAVVRQGGLDSALASKVYSQISDETSAAYTTAELSDYYDSLNGESDVFDYAYYYVAAETVETTAEDGTASTATTDETVAAAKATADAIAAAYKAETGEDATENLNAAVAASVADATASSQSGVSGSSVSSAYKDWLMGSRSAGDVTVAENTDSSGYYVVVFLSRSDNHYNMAKVRHILIKAVASDDGTYTDEAKAEAMAKAEEIYAEWKSGDKTEDSFAALAEEYSEDTGSNTKGGLYDSVYKGQTVEAFDEFCFAGHKYGDTDIVYGETSGYAGYHIMFYVGEGGLYSNYIAKNAMLSTDMEEWLTALTEGYEAKTGFGYRLVG